MLFVLFLSVFLAAGRGATLSLLVALLALVAMSFRGIARPAIAALAGLLCLAFLSTLLLHGEVAARLPQLMQDTSRWLIWESSWNMLKDAPWHGIGLGMYFLVYPRYRHPDDTTGGYFAHNDYLQFWIETGLPGPLLLLGAGLAVLWYMLRLLRRLPASDPRRIEATGLFAGLLAVAGHSAVDFNFYILSILVVAGLALGRWHELMIESLDGRAVTLTMSSWLRPRVFMPALAALTGIALFHFGGLGVSSVLYHRADEQAYAGQIEAASKSLAVAEMLTPSDDRIPATHAYLLRRSIGLLPKGDVAARRALYEEAQDAIDRAIASNPVRALTHAQRARLLRENPDLAGSEGSARAEAAYREALRLNPLLYETRTRYAEFLLEQRRGAEAREWLEHGVAYRYTPHPDLLPYYRLVQRLRREAGDHPGAAALDTHIESLNSRDVLRPGRDN
jgi:tetratricopeptide (TPR) repeat protein